MHSNRWYGTLLGQSILRLRSILQLQVCLGPDSKGDCM